MPIQAVWDNDEQTTIRYVIEGKWTWEEMNAAVATSNSWLDSVEYKVDFIHDMSQSGGIPSGALTQLKRYIGKEHSNTGRSVVVGPQKSVTNSVAHGLISMVQQLYKRDWGFTFADSLEGARQHLQDARGKHD